MVQEKEVLAGTLGGPNNEITPVQATSNYVLQHSVEEINV